ncbi:alpha/beta hydrolase [Moorena sp. SIOASIH]|uniref:alpha/beta fold hydrolase n=1 Tax=Moorena sp. SIOASIH TaxID=2607817 RepID=UPI0025DE1A50|nr:alpha/beta hydrolase [Moorena sp. SIOASIH]
MGSELCWATVSINQARQDSPRSVGNLSESDRVFLFLMDYAHRRRLKIWRGLLDLQQYFLYLMDYGAPVGYRLASKNANKVLGLIVQNGNAYEEGLREFWEPLKAYWQDKTPENAQVLADFLTLESTKWQYTNGVRNPEAIAPDNWFHDQYLLDRPGNKEIQLELFYSYGTNRTLYPQWQDYFRQFQPPTLIVWGKGDYIFPEEGAHPYKRDLNNLEFHILDTGHCALEEDLELIANYIRNFARSNSPK